MKQNVKYKLTKIKKQNELINTENTLYLKTRKEQKGITLIALVITIIVLLILAGVSIATLTGENGILTKANEAKTKTEKAGAYEQVQVEVLGSMGAYGTIDLEELNNNLKNNIPGLTYNGRQITEKDAENENIIDKLPAIVTLYGYSIVINEDGNVKEMPKEIADIIANPEKYYGKEVTNYNTSDETNTYRIFYVDKEGNFGAPNTIYLKADYSSQTYKLSESYESYEDNTKVKEMNPAWAKARGNNKNEWNENEKAAAYLCSPVNATNKDSATDLPWKDYYDEDAANYVIGGPSVEMYVKSYNEAYEGVTLENGKTKNTLGADYSSISSHGYIYTVNGSKSGSSDYYTIQNTLDCTQFNSMYCGKDGGNTTSEDRWWLASPSAKTDEEKHTAEYVCSVRCKHACLNNDSYRSDKGGAISPLVSLKSDFIPQVEK